MVTSASAPPWSLRLLQSHLQAVVDLEVWTVPYYMAAMYSIRDRTSDAYQLVQDVVHEEMLHIQLASNIANAFGVSPAFAPPAYGEATVPHLDFSLDVPNPTDRFAPFSTEIGPLDAPRVNTMCLIEYPEWSTGRRPDLREHHTEYGSIAEFYAAVRVGMYELRASLRGGVNQVDEFRRFYDAFPRQTIEHDGDEGFAEAISLIDLITDQGEGQSEGDTEVAPEHRNTADGFETSWSHFRRFTEIRDMQRLPDTYAGVAEPPQGSPGRRAQDILVRDFAAFMKTLEELFGGNRPPAFGVQMSKIGADVLTCWQRGAVPRFG